MGIWAARVDGTPGEIEVGSESLLANDRALAWVDMDHIEVGDHRVRVGCVDGTSLTVSHLGRVYDEVVAEIVEARSRARRAALLQWTGDAPLVQVDAKRGDERVRVHLFPDGLTVEPLTGVPDMLPLSCLVGIDRDGYDLALRARGLPDVHVRHAGNRTDELLLRIDQAVTALRARTADAYAQLTPGLEGLEAPDGWAIDAATAGDHWPALRAAVAGQRRAAEIDLLSGLAGDHLRLGIKSGAGGSSMPFALAIVDGRIAVEATDADDRATFVFETTDVDRLNAVLLATSFRREAISLPEDRLGRWSLAVRTLEVVRWARGALVARVVHDDGWATNVERALRG